MKMRQSFVLLIIAVGMAFLFYACKKSGSGDDKPGGEQAGKIQGMGDSTGRPQGTAFVLPDGISFSGQIRGRACDTAYEVGSGDLVEICVGIFNSKPTDVTLTIPAGLILIATDDVANQHGIVIQETRVVLKANKLTRVGLHSYCINSSKSPSSYDDIYTIGPVTSSTLMKELIGLLRTKKINREDYTNNDAYEEAKTNVQLLVWAISDGPALDIPSRNLALSQIPNK